MRQRQSLEQLQVIADTKSDLALARLADVNRLIAALEREREAVEQRLTQAARTAMSALEVQALDKYRSWASIRCAELDRERWSLQEKAAQLKELARLDFGKAQAIRKLRAQ